MCQSGVSNKAIFCHECGTIQPARATLTHFDRLGFDSRFDLDSETLAERYAAQQRIFKAQRFAGRGPRQRQLASEHLEKLDVAYATLCDPVRRAEYLLGLLDDGGTSPVLGPLADVEALRLDLNNALDGAAVDRVANQASRAVETCIRDLSAAFRQHEIAEVSGILARLAQLEAVANAARSRRATV
jgi:molecular chaperone HscB